MKRVNLFTQFYYDNNPARRDELEYCLLHNLHNDFNRVIIFMTKNDYENYFKSLDKENPIPQIFVKFVEDRPTFNNYFEEINDAIYADQINVIANSDIFFTYQLTDIREYMSKLGNDSCVALSRYDYDPENGVTPFHRPDSQDTWIFNDCPEVKTELEYGMGVAGCDNRLAFDILKHGYDIINPCSAIMTYHLHSSNVRNYLNENNEPINRIPPPYHLITPQ